MNDDKEKLNSILKEIKSKSVINFPKYEFPSLEEDDLLITKNSSTILFSTGEYYDKNTKTISFNNGEIFEGTIKNEGDLYYLDKGIYKWPSGQIFEGTLEENKMSKGKLIFGDNIYSGEFKNEYRQCQRYI